MNDYQDKGRIRSRQLACSVYLPLVCLAVGLGLAQTLRAQEKEPADAGANKPASHRGEFVSAADGKLMMSIDGESRHSHTLAPDARITLNGKPAELVDLKKGDKIQVTTKRDDPGVALGVAATREDRTSADRRSEAASDSEGNWLGVWIEPTPENIAGVRISAVHAASPAARAGLRPGDYILKLDGQEVRDPKQLTEMIANTTPGGQSAITTWRNGRQQVLEIDFGGQPRSVERRAFRGEDEQQAWLGVTLGQDREAAGINIRDVFPSGPAARAGLRNGDVITKLNEKPVANSEELIGAISELQPGDQVKLTVQRGDEELTLNATLGDRDEFLDDRFFDEGRQFERSEEFYRVPDHSMMLEQHRHIGVQHERIEKLLQQVLDELATLREEIEQVKKPKE